MSDAPEFGKVVVFGVGISLGTALLDTKAATWLADYVVKALHLESLGPFGIFAGLSLFLFACGEFVHYFLFKINMRPREWRAARARGRPVPARFRRELRRAEAAARRPA